MMHHLTGKRIRNIYGQIGEYRTIIQNFLRTVRVLFSSFEKKTKKHFQIYQISSEIIYCYPWQYLATEYLARRDVIRRIQSPSCKMSLILLIPVAAILIPSTKTFTLATPNSQPAFLIFRTQPITVTMASCIFCRIIKGSQSGKSGCYSMQPLKEKLPLSYSFLQYTNYKLFQERFHLSSFLKAKKRWLSSMSGLSARVTL